ncbi:MAG: restriction endonuclease subunit S [Candidatus Poribacteria bacterium]|nr:restriction endonuclease subunit S [Candidatus Poribacteria bacterium]
MSDVWPKKSLGELIEIKHGFAFKGEFFQEEVCKNILLTPGNFAIGGGFKSEKFKFYGGAVPNEYVLRQGDLIVTMTDLSKNADTLGYPAIIPLSDEGYRFLHNQRLGKVIITNSDLLDYGYLYYLMCGRTYRHEVLASATGTTVKHTAPERIKRFRFSLPSLCEQRQIAHVLGSLDDKIELNRQMNETLEATARAIFKSWFVDFDPVRAKMEGREPVGMDAKTASLFPSAFQDSPLGEIPEDWEVRTIGEDFNLTMGQSPPGSTYNEDGKGLPFYQGRKDFGFRYPTRRVFCTAPTRLAAEGDTLVSVRAPVGDINMASEKCCVGRGLAAIRHKTGSLSYSYYAMQFLQEDFLRYEAEGTVFGSINKENFEALSHLRPPDGIIEAFESLVHPMDQSIENNENQSDTLSEIRDALLPKLLSGEVRVA